MHDRTLDLYFADIADSGKAILVLIWKLSGKSFKMIFQYY